MTSIVFFGTGPVAAASLDFLRGIFDIEMVITKPRVPGFKGSTPVEELAKTHGYPVRFVANRADLDELFHNAQLQSSLGIVVDFGIIISSNVIERFANGIVNSHFSLLPRWRGADPISYTILSGDEKAGVSLMVINEGLDTGKLITSKGIGMDPKETTATLTEKLIALSNELMESYLPRYLSGDIQPKNQPHPDRVTFSHKISKDDGTVNWNEPATTIERKIRAYQPWPQMRTTLAGIDIIITEANVAEMGASTPGKIMAEKSRLFVGTAENWLEITKLKPAGKKEMPVQAFLAGYHAKLAN